MSYTTIDNPELYFQCKTYSGSGSNQSITLDGDENMQPDMVWIKRRSSTRGHSIFDVVRGATYGIYPDASDAQSAGSSQLTSFDSDGFSLGTDDRVSGSGHTYVSWNWKAGGSGSANNDGSINTTSTSANSTSGISISKFTSTGSAATIGHGMSAIPKMIWVKRTDSSASWQVYHASLGATKYLELQNNQEVYASSGRWNDTTPTSSVFSIAGEFGSSAVNISYAFAEKTGYCKIGSYEGNGNADGTFVYTGFKPAFIMIKRTDASGDWGIFDNKREGYNDETNRLKPNGTDAEEDDNFMDILSNGFKLRITSSSLNNSSGKYIFMAFAESPFVNSNGVPNNAR